MEAERLALQCLASAGTALVFYGAIIVGAELGGLVQGYSGRGKEIHEQVIKQVK